eukprot:TRINITY_DN69478_c0_g1_i1.p1 TRINITY_DN69478_c0_g1~~TRINITY_DN69478_c0_g1_i1.p1  ORF type:complete len:335 (+),score=57.03 TRINITY_DN69478_c0_g1_i1:195-1199(+)
MHALMAGRPITPVPGQGLASEWCSGRRPGGAANAFSSRGGQGGLYQPGGAAKGGFGAPPPKSGREDAYPTAAACERARRNSGSPEPGNARNSWNISGGSKRNAVGSDRVRTSPISARKSSPSAKRGTSPTSPNMSFARSCAGAGTAPLPHSPVATSWGWRPSTAAEELRVLHGTGFPAPDFVKMGKPIFFEDGLDFDYEEVTEEQWRSFDESVARLANEACFLRGMLKALQGKEHGDKVESGGRSRAMSPRAAASNRPGRHAGQGRENRSPQQVPPSKAIQRLSSKEGPVVLQAAGASVPFAAWPMSKDGEVKDPRQFTSSENSGDMVNLVASA